MNDGFLLTNLTRPIDNHHRFSTAARPASPLATTEAPAPAPAPADGGLPAPVKVARRPFGFLLFFPNPCNMPPVKAAPGPNGEEYYYYYYYYDDEEGEQNVSDKAFPQH